MKNEVSFSGHVPEVCSLVGRELKLVNNNILKKSVTDFWILSDLWDFAFRLTCNIRYAEKLVATTYMIGARGDIRLDTNKPPRVILFSVALSVWLKHGDDLARDVGNSFVNEGKHSPYSICCLEKLTEQERIVVTLVDGHRFNFEDAAWILNMKIETMQKLLISAYMRRSASNEPHDK